MNSYWDNEKARVETAACVNRDLGLLDLGVAVGVESAKEILQLPGWATCFYEGSSRIAAWATAIETTEADCIAAIAEMAQDIVMGTFHLSWPECPHHASPLIPKVVDQIPVWFCDIDAKALTKIGELDLLQSEAG